MSARPEDHPDRLHHAGSTDRSGSAGGTGNDGSDHGTPGATEVDPFEQQVRAALVASAGRYTPAPDLEARIESRTTEHGGRRPTRWLLAAAALVVVILLGSLVVRGDADQTVSMVPATDPPGTSVASTGPITAGPTTVVPGPTGTAPTPTPPPVMPATSAPTTTAAPALAPSAILRRDGFDGIPFGGSTAAAEQLIAARIGPAVGRFTDPACTARQIISWGSFAIWDQDGTFTEWRLIGDTSLGLQMDQGVGVGSSSSELVAAYPEASVGLNRVEHPVRRVVTLSTADGNVAWSAALDPEDRAMAMGAGPGVLWPDECPGRGATLLALVPHLAGVGMMPFGTPAARATAVMEAIYGPARGGSATDVGGCGDVVTTRYDASPFVSTVANRGHLVGYRMPPWSEANPSRILDADGGTLQTGMTIGEVRAAYGDQVVVGAAADPDGSYPVEVGPAPGAEVALLAGATGPTDADTLTTVGAVQAPRC